MPRRAGPRPRPELTVATDSIRAGSEPGDFPAAWWREVRGHRLERIADVITGLGVDVVALQEVAVLTVDGVLEDQTATLARLRAGADRTPAGEALPARLHGARAGLSRPIARGSRLGRVVALAYYASTNRRRRSGRAR